MEMNKSQHTSSTPTGIKFQLLEEITNGFSEECKVGSGGYGHVYKGVHKGKEIAVKKLHQMPGLDDEQFKKEFDNLMRIHHQNIVRLVAYCYEKRHTHHKHDGQFIFAEMAERAFCFEYMEGGSLANYLSDESSGLEWDTRYTIIQGICEGLDYLHNGTKDSIYHLDLKPANILLDKSMKPKIGDFGLSRLFASTETYTTKKFIGTLGYMPPEYINKRKISSKFDVFSLGVIIMQIMTGPLFYTESADSMTSQEITELVHENWEKRLQPMPWHTSQQVKTCIEIALRCVEADRVKRPTITEIIDELKRIDKAKISPPIGQSSGSELLTCTTMDPMELRFPLELNKEVRCVLQLTNRTDDTVAFSTKMNRDKYYAQPDKGTVAPCSRHYIIVTMRPRDSAAAADMQRNDVFLVQTWRVTSKEEEELVLVGKVDEANLPIVLVPLTNPIQLTSV